MGYVDIAPVPHGEEVQPFPSMCRTTKHHDRFVQAMPR